MKNLKHTMTIIVMAIFMLGIFNIKAQESQFKLKPEHYGEIHNQILKTFYKSGKKVSDYTSSDYTSIDDLIDDLTKIALKLHPEFEKYNGFYDGIDIVKSSFKEKNIKKIKVYEVLKNNLWRMRNPKKNVDLYDITLEFLNFKQYNQIKDKYPNLNPFEKELIERFNSVMNYSNSFWSSYNQTKSNGVIFADAIGTLIFWETGPGAVIAGAAYSMLVNTYE